MPLELQGYTPVFAGESTVYARVPDETITVQGEDIAVRHLILLARYRQPTEEHVLAYLQQEAQNASRALMFPTGVKQRGEKLTERVLKELNQDSPHFIDDLRTGNERLTGLVKEYIDVAADQGTINAYIHLQYGILPVATIQKNQEAGTIQDARWYASILTHPNLRSFGFGHQWSASIALYDSKMPPTNELSILLKHGTIQSRTLEVNAKKYIRPEELTSVIIPAANALSSQENIQQLKDIADKVLDEHAYHALTQTITFLTAQQAAAKQASAFFENVLKQNIGKPGFPPPQGPTAK